MGKQPTKQGKNLYILYIHPYLNQIELTYTSLFETSLLNEQADVWLKLKDTV